METFAVLEFIEGNPAFNYSCTLVFVFLIIAVFVGAVSHILKRS